MFTLEADVVDSNAPVGNHRLDLLLNISCYLRLLLQKFLEGEDGYGILDDSSGDLHQGSLQVFHPEVVQMRLIDVIVDAGVYIDRDIVFVLMVLPRVIKRWLGSAATLILQSMITISSVIAFT